MTCNNETCTMERLRTDEADETTEDYVDDGVDGIFATANDADSRSSSRLWIRVLTVFSVALSLDVVLSMVYILVEKPPVNDSMRTAGITTDSPLISEKLNNATLPQWKPLPDYTQTLSKIAFGSCASQQMPQPHWDTVTKYAPDLFILAGDNVYGDCTEETCQHLRQAYKDMAQHVSVQGAAPHMAVYATLDDHDYGFSDCDGSNPYKHIARELFAEFFAIPWSDLADKDGVYRSGIWGIHGDDNAVDDAESPNTPAQTSPPRQRLQIILLDTRFDRSPFTETGIPSAPYTPATTSTSTHSSSTLQMLSAKQWQWLEEQLQQPAELRLLVSSVQVLNDGTGFEAWRQLPSERDRLYKLIHNKSVVILSGDRHVGGMYEFNETFMEATASSLTHTVPLGVAFNSHCFTAADCDEQDPRRVGDGIRENHFGSIEIDWANLTFSLALRRTETSFGSPYANASMRHGKLGDAGTVIVSKTFSFPF